VSDLERLRHVPAAPTRPGDGRAVDEEFDVADLYEGPLSEREARGVPAAALDEKIRQAYFWIVNHGIISPFYDIEYRGDAEQEIPFGDSRVAVHLPSGQSYSSYVLLPLLTLAARRKCLLVGGPGRGKTAIAVLMGLLGGYTLKEVRRGIQHGQPQLTVADLLGSPLPSSLISAKSSEEVKVAWRSWLGMRVRIVDEYNRIPTKTQSALLTVLADDYAEVFDQVYECPPAAWYLTANDDAGGGTYQVIEALRDRIDVVVKALHFNSRFLPELLARIEAGVAPEDLVPPEIVFTPDELARMTREVRAVTIPLGVRRRIEFFASWFEFFEPGGRQLEYMTKDTVRVAAQDLDALASSETGKDPHVDLGNQTRNGLSVRALLTCLTYVKAIAWFRGAREATIEDTAQILPFVLHDKLEPRMDSPFFEQASNTALRADRVSWIRQLFDAACREYDRLDLDRDDPARRLKEEMDLGLEGVGEAEVRKRMATIERTLRDWSRGRKLYGPMFDDVLALKYLHQRYTNYLTWLRWKG
jgi:MoxR-like ATPase